MLILGILVVFYGSLWSVSSDFLNTTTPSPPPSNNSINNASQPSIYSDLTLSEHEQEVVVKVRVAMGFLSLVGSLFIVISMFLFERHKQMSSRLVLALSIVCFIEAVANIMSIGLFESEQYLPEACIAQGWLLQFSQNAIFSWTLIIAINLYLVVVKAITTLKFEWVYHLVVWGWALFVSFIPFVSKAYGPAGLWCWLNRFSGQPFRWAFFYIPLFVQIIAVIVLYSLIIKTVANAVVIDDTNTDNDKRKNRLLLRLRAYPVIFLCLYVFPVINRIYDAASDDDSFFLYLMQSLSAPSMGFAIAIAYGLDEEMRRLWKKKILPSYTREDDESSSEEEAKF